MRCSPRLVKVSKLVLNETDGRVETFGVFGALRDFVTSSVRGWASILLILVTQCRKTRLG